MCQPTHLQKHVHAKSHTHVKKVGTFQNFFLAFIEELEKQLFTMKTVEVGCKKQNNFNI